MFISIKNIHFFFFILKFFHFDFQVSMRETPTERVADDFGNGAMSGSFYRSPNPSVSVMNESRRNNAFSNNDTSMFMNLSNSQSQTAATTLNASVRKNLEIYINFRFLYFSEVREEKIKKKV